MGCLFVLGNPLEGTMLVRDWPEFSLFLWQADVLIILCCGLAVQSLHAIKPCLLAALLNKSAEKNQLELFLGVSFSYIVYCREYQLSQSPLHCLLNKWLILCFYDWDLFVFASHPHSAGTDSFPAAAFNFPRSKLHYAIPQHLPPAPILFLFPMSNSDVIISRPWELVLFH